MHAANLVKANTSKGVIIIKNNKPIERIGTHTHTHTYLFRESAPVNSDPWHLVLADIQTKLAFFIGLLYLGKYSFSN